MQYVRYVLCVEQSIKASAAGGRTICSHNSLAPPPHVGHQPGHMWRWDGIPFLNVVVLVILAHTAHTADPTSPHLVWAAWQAITFSPLPHSGGGL